ncbi:uncharacterized protein [Prorops nasuta]|uniref:uncharacterized protein n=1 Tax=Prorops nasuta TaxID=863751 RepID=UPI0034CEE73E
MQFLLLLCGLLGVVLARPGHPETIFLPANYYHGPAAPLDHKGRVVDTPEVAHAKAAHLAAHAAEAAKTGGHGYASGYDFEGGFDGFEGGHVGNYVEPVAIKYDAPAKYHVPAVQKYHGPPAPLAHDGRVIDTPEVAHAKAAHFAAHAEELTKIAHLQHSQPFPYHPIREFYLNLTDSKVLQMKSSPTVGIRAASLGVYSCTEGVLRVEKEEKREKLREEVLVEMSMLILSGIEEGTRRVATNGERRVLMARAATKESIFMGVVSPAVAVPAAGVRVGHAPVSQPALAKCGAIRVFDQLHIRSSSSNSAASRIRSNKMIAYLTIFSAVASMALGVPQYYPSVAGYYGGQHFGGHAGGPPAPLGPDGRVVDTPEVAQLKAAHLSALAEATARAPKGPGPAGPYGPPDTPYTSGGYVPHYSGPPAPLGPDGRVVDTPEVQQAKAVHFSLYNAEAQRVPAGPADSHETGAYNPAYHSGAYVPGLYNGYNHY